MEIPCDFALTSQGCELNVDSGSLAGAEAGANPARSRHCDRSTAESQTPPAIWPLNRGRASPRSTHMPAAAFAHIDSPPVALPLGQVLPWAVFGGLILLLALYFVGAEEGATSLIKGMYVDEFVHDGRPLLGFPCH